MKRLLWVGDAVVASGFSRVTHSVLDRLKDSYDVHVLGVNYAGDPHEYDYPIWPARLGGDLLGVNRLAPVVERIKPDIVLLFNDIWVVAQYLAKLEKYEGKTATYFPVDAAGYKEEWIKALNSIDKVLVYTKFAQAVLRDAGYVYNATSIPHGIDPKDFHHIGGETARRHLPAITEDSFVVFNGNRNQPRKRIDITIKGFCIFAEQHPEAKLYLHTGLRDVGWDILSLMNRECRNHNLVIGDRLIITNPNLSPANPVSVEQLNVIYNACDVGLNTSLGEGWGLVSFEQAACKVPQIVPNYSACPEIFEGAAQMLPIRQYITAPGISTEGGLVYEEDVAEALEWTYNNREAAAANAEVMYNRLQEPKYSWDTIAEQFKKELDTL